MLIEISQETQDFIISLEKSAIAKIFRIIELLELFGFELKMPHSKKISGSLFELRVHGKQEVRIFYTVNNDKAQLLFGYVKKTKKIPNRIMKKINSLI